MNKERSKHFVCYKEIVNILIFFYVTIPRNVHLAKINKFCLINKTNKGV